MVDPITEPLALAGCSLAIRSLQPRPRPTPGRTYVLLHGIAATGMAWMPVARILSAAGHRVHALDFRGHGQSDRPEAGYDLPTFAADLLGTIDGLGLDRPIVVGHSLGAAVILAALAARPEVADAWEGIALVEGGLVPAREQFDSFEECERRLALPPVNGMPLTQVRGYLRGTNPSWSEERLAAALDCFDVDDGGTVSWRLTAPRYAALMRALWDQDVAAGWARLDGRVLILAADTGDAAWTYAKRLAAEHLIADRPRARVAWVMGDHDIHLDRPADVAEALVEAIG